MLPAFDSDGQTGVGTQIDAEKEELENPQRPTWLVKTNPFRYYWGPIPFTSEYRLHVESITSRYQSTEVGISYLGESPILKNMIDSLNSQLTGNYRSVDIKVRGARLQLAHKFYLKGIFPNMDPGLTISSYAPNGYYIAPYFSFSYARFSLNDAPVPFMEMTHLNGNLIAGRQMFLWGNFALDVFLGIGYKENIWEIRDPQNQNATLINNDNILFYGGNFRFMLGFNIGLGY